MVTVSIATIKDLKSVAPLFNAYRVFYNQESNLDAATQFLYDLISNNQSIILMATFSNKVVGFTQLYTTYSSVSLQPTLILNDLYVDEANRKNGIGEALLNEAKMVCIANNYKGLALETAFDNPAQKLYEKLGWEKDSGYFHYFWSAK
ncbi:GNAT family N-acetyltransferase [Aurantibacter sp.]|uniref:GNAT family N-acetyltransferase n=1 Tax=Aurantibacter sp. TaxID=2807103 RepID=UPI00326556CE